MACSLPFRPWFYPGLRVFRFRTTWDQSTDPTHVLSCTCAPPQWLAPTLVVPRKRRGRPCPHRETPRMHPRPFSIPGPRNPFVRWARDPASRRSCRTVRKSRLQGLATLLAASAPRPTEACFSSPRSWASLFRAFFRPRSLTPRFPGVRPLLRFTVRPNGLTPALQRFALAKPAAPTSSPTLFG